MARYIRTVYTNTAGIRRKYETKKQWNTPDPDGINELLDLIRSLKAEGMTILVSSHQLLEISKVADHILILDKGKIQYDGENKNVDSLERLFFKIVHGG